MTQILKEAFNKPYCQMTAIDGLIIATVVIALYITFLLFMEFIKRIKNEK